MIELRILKLSIWIKKRFEIKFWLRFHESSEKTKVAFRFAVVMAKKNMQK